MVLKPHPPQLISSQKEITPMSAEELEDQKRMDQFLDSLLDEPTDILNQEKDSLFREQILNQELESGTSFNKSILTADTKKCVLQESSLKVKDCKFWPNCKFGDSCKYRHH